jgi:hypothetical protein
MVASSASCRRHSSPPALQLHQRLFAWDLVDALLSASSVISVSASAWLRISDVASKTRAAQKLLDRL